MNKAIIKPYFTNGFLSAVLLLCLQSINTSFPTVILIAKTLSGLNPKHPRILFNKELRNLIKKSAPFTTTNKLFDKSNEQEIYMGNQDEYL